MLTLCYVAQKKPAGKRIVLRDALEKCAEMGIYMEMLDVILDAVIDTVKLIPFLFLTYLAMEYLEHKTGSKAQRLVQRAGRFGPDIGGLLGGVPQCGFSAAASGLYTGRVITLGTLFAIYLSTSDEMLPILISEQAPIGLIGKILFAKAAIGIFAGMRIDFVLRKKGVEEHEHIHEICEHVHCHCEEGAGVFRSALTHTLQISIFILVVTFGLNLNLQFVGEDAMANLVLNRRILGPALAGLIGLITNCAGSVAITQFYLVGAMRIGYAMAGLLTGSGVGLLILFRLYPDKKENLKILALLYGIGVLAGILIG